MTKITGEILTIPNSNYEHIGFFENQFSGKLVMIFNVNVKHNLKNYLGCHTSFKQN